TWIVGGKDANTDQKEVGLTQQPTPIRQIIAVKGTPVTAASTPVHTSASADLLGLDIAPLSPQTEPASSVTSTAHLSPGWESGYDQLYFSTEGTLFEDKQILMGYRSEFRVHLGVCKLYFTNKSNYAIGSFTTTIDNPSDKCLKIDTKSLPDSQLQPFGRTQQIITFEALEAFTKSPTIRVSYLAGALQTYTLRLPVVMHKYMEPSSLSADDFFKRWGQIGGPPLESKSTFSMGTKGHLMNSTMTTKTVEAFHWKVLPGVDKNPNNVVGCSVFQASSGKTGCLMRLEPNYESKMYRLTVRATQAGVPDSLVEIMADRLKHGGYNDERKQ
ncbi:hypothetical protein KEM54_004239, partial [Ascosphaera aggregata]